MKIILIVSCLEWLTCLSLFIMVVYSPGLKMVLNRRSKADFTVGNIYIFYQYFGRHGLPSSGSYIQCWG